MDQYPEVHRIFAIRQVESGLQDEYDQYRSRIQGEVLLFHGTSRKCRVGDPDMASELCGNKTCALCSIMYGGYDITRSNPTGLLGQGLYSAALSSKATSYSKNAEDTPAEGSEFKAVMINAVSLGKSYQTSTSTISWDPSPSYLPPFRYDSVHGYVDTGSPFDTDELVVYQNDALRPAFLIICDNVEVESFPDYSESDREALANQARAKRLSRENGIPSPEEFYGSVASRAIATPDALFTEFAGAIIEGAAQITGAVFDTGFGLADMAIGTIGTIFGGGGGARRQYPY
ncbi:hypothetical protein FRB95_009790 [Tulasnella sp. JGI-2019a]|nr:hypothetical protein FRB95_009790 [Tulasnella sp. JGI-2019a]